MLTVKNQEHVIWMLTVTSYTSGKHQETLQARQSTLQEYIQKGIGYSISGSNKEQCAYFLYGMGNNGKSTFLDTIADMLGDYASNAQPDTLMLQSRVGSLGGGANSDIARLKSARFVTCEEPTEGVRLNEGLLKQYDGILTLKNGSIVEAGTFNELIAEKGYFYSLFTISQ